MLPGVEQWGVRGEGILLARGSTWSFSCKRVYLESSGETKETPETCFQLCLMEVVETVELDVLCIVGPALRPVDAHGVPPGVEQWGVSGEAQLHLGPNKKQKKKTLPGFGPESAQHHRFP